MKNTMVSVLVLLATSISFAQTLPADLEITMKNMGSTLKTIATQFQDATKNAASATLSGEIVVLTAHAQVFVPTTVQALPADQQAVILVQYKSLLSETGVTASQMMAAFQKNENAKLPALLQKMKDLRASGHGIFIE